MEQLFNPNSPLILIPFLGGLILLSIGGILTSLHGWLRILGSFICAFGGVLFYGVIINYWPKSTLASILAPILVLMVIVLSMAVGNQRDQNKESTDKRKCDK